MIGQWTSLGSIGGVWASDLDMDGGQSGGANAMIPLPPGGHSMQELRPPHKGVEMDKLGVGVEVQTQRR